MLAEGLEAPDFVLPAAQNGVSSSGPFVLSRYRGRPVVLFFYPHNLTPGCRGEVCGFRDQYEEFLALDAVVVGVNAGEEAAHQRFIEQFALPFPLLSDVGGRVRRLYDVPRLYGILPLQARVTYVIDAEGIIRYVFNSNRNPVEHVARTLEALRRVDEAPADSP
ncbi:MAG: peroxiredoxin [Hymenobacteraceae bacterium]|nr:peroxiredoxin [Hymenobacteraceae bacterium]